MTIVGLAGIERIDLVPLGPAVALFDFEFEGAGDDRCVDKSEALIGLRISRPEKFGERFLGLARFRGVRAHEVHLAKSRPLVIPWLSTIGCRTNPEGAQPTKQFFLLFFLKRRWKLPSANFFRR